MLLSDPEMESSILISSDEGATYQKYRLTFYIQSLLFHPKQEDWVLAYSLDQKVIKYCFHVHPVTQVPLIEKHLFIPSKFWKGPSGIPLFQASWFCLQQLTFLSTLKHQNMWKLSFIYWQCYLLFHKFKIVFYATLFIWLLKQPCEISRKCVLIIIV